MQSRGRRRGPHVKATGTIAAALPLAVLAIVMLLLQSTISETARFVAFCLLGIGLPGIVLWRLIGGYRRNLVEDCAAGFAVGTSAQIIVYLASASVGLQRWSWAWAPIVLIVALADSDVRVRVWRRVEEPLRPLQAWLLSASCAIVLFVVYLRGPHRFVPAFTDPLKAYPDLAFHQALAASAKYDVPIGTLWLDDEPMYYHTVLPPVDGRDRLGDPDRPDRSDPLADVAAAAAGRLCVGVRPDATIPDRCACRYAVGRCHLGGATRSTGRRSRWSPAAVAGRGSGRDLDRGGRLPQPDAEPRGDACAGALPAGGGPAARPPATKPVGTADRRRDGRVRREVDRRAHGGLRFRAGLRVPAGHQTQDDDRTHRWFALRRRLSRRAADGLRRRVVGYRAQAVPDLHPAVAVSHHPSRSGDRPRGAVAHGGSDPAELGTRRQRGDLPWPADGAIRASSSWSASRVAGFVVSLHDGAVRHRPDLLPADGFPRHRRTCLRRAGESRRPLEGSAWGSPGRRCRGSGPHRLCDCPDRRS